MPTYAVDMGWERILPLKNLQLIQNLKIHYDVFVKHCDMQPLGSTVHLLDEKRHTYEKLPQ